MTYAGLGLDPCLHTSTLTQILHYGKRSSATREHSTHSTASFVPDGFIGVCYTILSPSLHSQCVVVISHKGIAQMLALPGYVASTTNHDHKQAYNERSLTDTDGVTTSSLKLGASQDSTRSRFKSHNHPHTSGSTLTLEKPTSSIYI
jgi:hypothetical protein